MCSDALLILLIPFVQAEMGLGDVSRNTVQQPGRQAREPVKRPCPHYGGGKGHK